MKAINDQFSLISVNNSNLGEENAEVKIESAIDLNSSFSMGVNMVQAPLFHNNLYYWMGGSGVYTYQVLDPAQNSTW